MIYSDRVALSVLQLTSLKTLCVQKVTSNTVKYRAIRHTMNQKQKTECKTKQNLTRLNEKLQKSKTYQKAECLIITQDQNN